MTISQTDQPRQPAGQYDVKTQTAPESTLESAPELREFEVTFTISGSHTERVSAFSAEEAIEAASNQANEHSSDVDWDLNHAKTIEVL